MGSAFFSPIVLDDGLAWAVPTQQNQSKTSWIMLPKNNILKKSKRTHKKKRGTDTIGHLDHTSVSLNSETTLGKHPFGPKSGALRSRVVQFGGVCYWGWMTWPILWGIVVPSYSSLHWLLRKSC